MKQSLLYALFSALITAAFLNGAPAFGQTAGEPRTHVSVVSTADLDLGTAEGERRLQQRLGQAAREVCGTASDADLKGLNEVRQCRSEAIANALYQHEQQLAQAKGGTKLTFVAKR